MVFIRSGAGAGTDMDGETKMVLITHTHTRRGRERERKSQHEGCVSDPMFCDAVENEIGLGSGGSALAAALAHVPLLTKLGLSSK